MTVVYYITVLHFGVKSTASWFRLSRMHFMQKIYNIRAEQILSFESAQKANQNIIYIYIYILC